MAAKKKVHSSSPGKQVSKPALDVAVYGTQVRFVGAGGVQACCVQCGKKTSRGMVRQRGEVFFCSTQCVDAEQRAKRLEVPSEEVFEQ